MHDAILFQTGGRCPVTYFVGYLYWSDLLLLYNFYKMSKKHWYDLETIAYHKHKGVTLNSLHFLAPVQFEIPCFWFMLICIHLIDWFVVMNNKQASIPFINFLFRSYELYCDVETKSYFIVVILNAYHLCLLSLYANIFAIFWRQQICYLLMTADWLSLKTANWLSSEDSKLAIYRRQQICYLLKTADLLSTDDSKFAIFWRQQICYLLKTANLLSMLPIANLLSTDGSRFFYLVKIADWLSSEMGFVILLKTADLLSTEDSKFAIYWRQQICYLLKTANWLSSEDSRFTIFWRQQICYLYCLW